MLVLDFHAVGNKLLSIRKRVGMTQAEVAEAAGLSDRTYADIERGTVNMRVETILRICNVLHITPDEILTEENITTKRPGNGISAMKWFDVLGTKAIRDFGEDELICTE